MTNSTEVIVIIEINYSNSYSFAVADKGGGSEEGNDNRSNNHTNCEIEV